MKAKVKKPAPTEAELRAAVETLKAYFEGEASAKAAEAATEIIGRGISKMELEAAAHKKRLDALQAQWDKRVGGVH